MRYLWLVLVLLLSPPAFAQPRTVISSGPTLPTACNGTNGEIFFKTTVPVGLHECTPSNTWRFTAGSTSGPPGNFVRTCVVAIGDPGAASAFLSDDNDSPVACSNNFGTDWTITSVACYANAGSPTVTPILTGGTATSVLTGALTCGTASWAAGSVNGSPVVHSFIGGATCSVTPCSIDVNITAAGGAAKYIVIKITGTI